MQQPGKSDLFVAGGDWAMHTLYWQPTYTPPPEQGYPWDETKSAINIVEHIRCCLISYFLYFLFLISYFLFLISYFSYFLFLISYFLFHISYFLFPISYFLFLISYFLFPISYFLCLPKNTRIAGVERKKEIWWRRRTIWQ